MIKEKSFYKTFILLALPIVLQNVISLGVNLADNMMLGRYSEFALSGVAAVNQIQFVYQNLLLGASDVAVILAAQYWGKRDTESIKKVAAVQLRVGLGVMVVLFAIVSIFPHWVLHLFTTDATIIAEGMKYLNIVRFSYPFFCVTYMMLAILRSTEVVKIAFWLSVSTLCVNCGINWVLIYGHFGAPRLGAQGAAIGTVTARVVEFIIILYFLKKKEKNLHFKLSDLRHVDRLIMSDYLRIGIPMIIVQGLWGVNNAIQTAILGHLSASAIAANSMASNLYLIVKTMAVGSASATAVIMGKVLGAGRMDEVKKYVKTFQIMFLVVGVVAATILFLLIEPVLSLYSFSDESRMLARSFLHVLCIVMIGMSYQMSTNFGIVRSGGDTAFILKMDIVCIWCIVVPLSFIAAFVWNAPPIIVVWCLNLDQIFKAIPAFFKVNFGHWAKNLTR